MPTMRYQAGIRRIRVSSRSASTENCRLPVVTLLGNVRHSGTRGQMCVTGPRSPCWTRSSLLVRRRGFLNHWGHLKMAGRRTAKCVMISEIGTPASGDRFVGLRRCVDCRRSRRSLDTPLAEQSGGRRVRAVGARRRGVGCRSGRSA